MLQKSLLTPRKPRSFRPSIPVIELLEDRCVPAAAALMPSGQDLIQLFNNTLNAFEANRTQANNAILASQAQHIDQLNQVIGAVDGQIASLIDNVTQAREQLDTDIQNGASVQQQFADLLNIQTVGLASEAGINQAQQLRAAAIQHTAQQLQLDAQLSFSINQMITQQEGAFTAALLPFIQQAVINQPPDVGPALQANATVIYNGTFVTEFGSTPGENIRYTTAVSPTVTVAADGVTLTGIASAEVTRLFELNFQTDTFQSTSGSVSGSLVAPNSNQAKGFFSVTYDQGLGNVVYPWAGAVGLNKIIGQITDPLSGVTTPFTLNMVPPP